MANLGDLNDRLFRELDRLDALDMDDQEAVEREVERAHAIQGLAQTTINNAGTILAAMRMQRDAETGVAGTVHVPRMLSGGD